MSGCMNGPAGCMTDRHLMINSGGKNASFFSLPFSTNKCRKAPCAPWTLLEVELVRDGWCVLSESDRSRPRAGRPGLTRGPVGGFEALD